VPGARAGGNTAQAVSAVLPGRAETSCLAKLARRYRTAKLARRHRTAKLETTIPYDSATLEQRNPAVAHAQRIVRLIRHLIETF